MHTKVRLFTVVAIAFSVAPQISWAQRSGRNIAGEHWVASWATAQDLMPVFFGRPGGRPPGPPPAQVQNAAADKAVDEQGTARPPQAPRRPPASNLPATFADQTVRMVVRASLGGRRVRIELSNMLGARPLDIGAAHIARYKGDGAIVEGTDRVLTFSGSPSYTVPPGVLAVSDPVDLEVAPLSDLAVSLYLPHDTGAPTSHLIGLHTAYISKGDVTGSVNMPEPATMFAYVWLSSVDVAAAPEAFTIVALGDSITDGFATTRDADRAWPTLLAKRLSANRATRHIAVVNQGVSGNQVLRDGAGVSALARFDRDVLSRPGVKWVILLEGINDINIRGRVDGPNALTADELIQGYRQIITRCHAYGIKVMGATIMPEEGVPTASERGEGIRQAVNKWIRAAGNFDAVVDFDAVVRDPEHPARIKARFDPGDHVHPNDEGNQAMADAFDLTVLK
jgi:lysophospholipase L1-like esterase